MADQTAYEPSSPVSQVQIDALVYRCPWGVRQVRARLKECKKCGHKWLARLSTRKIHLCPKCKSTRWYIDDNHPPEGDAVTGRHSILGSPEGYQDSETGEGTMDPSGCLQAATPAQSPHNAAADGQASMGLPIIPPICQDPDCPHCKSNPEPTPTELHRASEGWLSEVDRIHNEARDVAEMAINPPWLKPSDPATIVESLNELDDILSETNDQGLDGGDLLDHRQLLEETEWEPEPPPEVPKPAPPAPTQRRVVVPPEARGWDEEDD